MAQPNPPRDFHALKKTAPRIPSRNRSVTECPILTEGHRPRAPADTSRRPICPACTANRPIASAAPAGSRAGAAAPFPVRSAKIDARHDYPANGLYPQPL
jgi:hypothetical protein